MKFEDKELDNILNIAKKYHKGQTDRNDRPYIEHIESVVDILCFYHKIKDKDILMAGMLHDTLEDTDMTEEKLIELDVSSSVINLVKLLSRNINKTDYYKNIAKNDKALIIKMADIQSNTLYHRLSKLDVATRNRLIEKYQNAIQELIKYTNNKILNEELAYLSTKINKTVKRMENNI